MYEEYFGLKRPPFRITPDTSLFYDGGHRGDILGALVYAVHRGEGIVKVVGEVGSGKTMLCRMLQLELPENTEIIYIANPSVSADDILFVIASELKFDIQRGASKYEVVSMLQNYLLKRHADDRQVVLFVEEAQGMPLETLEEIRLLSNLETDQHKLLQIILFGQPELDENLARNSIRQLRERITHEFNLYPLSAEEIHTYLNFRMREVGYTGPELISDKLASKMETHSEGLLRRINILADKMLLSAFADDTHTLTSKHLQDAVKDSGFSRISNAGPSGNRLGWLAAFGLLLVAALTYGLWQSHLFSVSSIKTSIEKMIKPAQQASQQQRVKPDQKMPEIARTITPDRNKNRTVAASNANIYEIHISQHEKPRIEPELGLAVESSSATQEMTAGSKKIQQSEGKLDKVIVKQAIEVSPSRIKKDKQLQWLDKKIESSKYWLSNADKQGVSIQVMMRSKDAAKELAVYLQTEWPLDLDKTYLYEVKMKGKDIYRIFYNEYPTITVGQMKMKQLPESVRVNSPYLHSIYRMQQALL